MEVKCRKRAGWELWLVSKGKHHLSLRSELKRMGDATSPVFSTGLGRDKPLFIGDSVCLRHCFCCVSWQSVWGYTSVMIVLSLCGGQGSLEKVGSL